MTKLFISLLLIASATSAFADDLVCQTKVNTVLAATRAVSVAVHASASYGEIEGFRLKINNLGDSKFELEVFSGADLFRSYADGTLRSSADEVRWTFWSRDVLLETSCRLASARS